ncbi:hypothetical protein FRB94_003526 [Tulasnella sp. JGI-2019a]|nr:hypothetical protein FRB94_003526 [Tulasnella sp. JGI-2019a]
MSVQTGLYIITNKQMGMLIGQLPIEDKSLCPKCVCSLPQGIQPPRWEVQNNSSDYTMKIMRASVGAQDSVLFTFLIDEGAEQNKWSITPTPQHGPDIIELADRSAGWAVPSDDPETQLVVQPLISTKSLPPQYPASQLFTLIHIDRE